MGIIELLNKREREKGIKTGIKTGRMEGIKTGIKKGEQLKALATAGELKNLGVSVDIIAKATGLSAQVVESL